ncbi:MAG: tetratricopeptide repeat protein [Deltaproteobacteria bacterium]|nr:tetratricopeptide repeat protein [Deltaproteobacteria bacterium]
MKVDLKAWERLGNAVAEELGTGPDPARRARQRQLVREHAFAPVPTPWRPPRWALAMGMAATVALVCGWLAMRSSPIAFSVDSGAAPARPGGWLLAPARQPLAVDFEEGTRYELEAGTSGQLAEASTRRVRFVLSNGAVSAQIRSKGRSQWSVEAGAYRVVATGTEFTVRWSAQKAFLQVAVTSGKVIVEGEDFESGLPLSAGHELTVDQRTRQVSLHTIPAPDAPAPAPGPDLPEVAANPDQDLEPAPARAAAAKTADARRHPKLAQTKRMDSDWRRLCAAGAYAEALEEAERDGLEELLGSASSEDLQLLADAARFANEGATARRVLQAIRRRFPGTPQARTSTFLLGRLHAEQLHDPTAAADWFSRYLQEDPAGPLAEEALGRRIDACRQADRLAEAREAAERYLARYPGGIFEVLAKDAAND